MGRAGDADDPHRLPVQLNGQVDPPAGAPGTSVVLLDHQTGQSLLQHLTGPQVALPDPLRIGAGKNHPCRVHNIDVVSGDLLDLLNDRMGRGL